MTSCRFGGRAFHNCGTAAYNKRRKRYCQVCGSKQKTFFLTEVGLEVYKSILLTLFRCWRSIMITTRKPLKLLWVSIFVPEIRNLKSQLVISCWPWKVWQFDHCNYGEHLNQALWDRFVWGLINPLTAWNVKLKTYMGEILDVLGKMQCSIVCKGKRY